MHLLAARAGAGLCPARRGSAAAPASVSESVATYRERTLAARMRHKVLQVLELSCKQTCTCGGQDACEDECSIPSPEMRLACPPASVQEAGEAGACSAGERGTTGPSRFAPRACRRGKPSGCPSRWHNSPQRVCRRRSTAERAFSAADSEAAPQFQTESCWNHGASIFLSTSNGPYLVSNSRARAMRPVTAALFRPVGEYRGNPPF